MKKIFILFLCFSCIFLVSCRKKYLPVDSETKKVVDQFLSYDITPDISTILKSDTPTRNERKVQKTNLENLDLTNIPKDYDKLLPQLEEIQLISETAALQGMNMLHSELPGIPVTNTWIEFDYYTHAVNKRYAKLSYTENSISYMNYLDMDYDHYINSGSYRFYYVSVVNDGNDEIIYYHSIIHSVDGDNSYHLETQYKYIKGKMFFYHQGDNIFFSDLVIYNENIDGEQIVYGYGNSGRPSHKYKTNLDFSIYGNEKMGYLVHGYDEESYFYKDGYRLFAKKDNTLGAHVNLLKIRITDYIPKHFTLLGYDDGFTPNVRYNRVKINSYILNNNTEEYMDSFNDYNYNIFLGENPQDYNLDLILDNFQDEARDLVSNFMNSDETYRFKAIKTFWPEFDEFTTNRDSYKQWFHEKFLSQNFLSITEIKAIPFIEDKVLASEYDLSNVILMDETLFEVDVNISSNEVFITILHSRLNMEDPKHQHFLNGNFRKVVALIDVSNDKIYPLIYSDYTQLFNSRYIKQMSLDEFKDKFNLIPDGKYLSVVYYEKETTNGWEKYGQTYCNDWTQIIKNEILLYWHDSEITKVIRQDIASSIPNIYYKHITILSTDD